jgi:prepilin-type N-terminal cleavage/methylation domain-containing protein
MNKIKDNQKGFGLIESLLVILIIAVIGFGGYYVWHTQRTKTPTITTTISTPTASTQQYLTIKEWGVRVPMPSDVAMSDIYYVTGTDTLDGSSSEVGLASHKISALTSDCIPQAGVNESPFGWIVRMTPAAYQQAAADYQDTGLKNGTLLGSYYYVWRAPVANCAENDDGNSKITASYAQVISSDNFPDDMSAILKSIAVSS